MKLSALISIPIFLAIAYFYFIEKSHYSQKIDEWNTFIDKSQAVTEIYSHVKVMNDGRQALEINTFLTSVDDGLDYSELNGKDKERLCRLYDQYSMFESYRKCQRNIITSAYEYHDLKAWIRTVKKQLAFNAARGSERSITEHLGEKLSAWVNDVDSYSNQDLLSALDSIDDSMLDSQDRYHIAKTLLEYQFNTEEAVSTLHDLMENSDNLRLVSKSYFIVAKFYLANDQREEALRTYSDYVDYYKALPRYETFVNKAYQRLLQIQMALDDKESIFDAKSELIEFVANAADLRSYFDSSRKLVYAGFSREGMSVFELGVQKLESMDLAEFSLYQKVRLYVEVIRAGNTLGISYALHNKYIRLVDQTLGFGLDESIKTNSDMSYLYSQYLLWSGEAFVIHEKNGLAENYYARFVAQFKSSPDYEFAIYKLLEVCSTSRQCFRDGVIKVTAPTEGGYLSEQVLGTFSDLAAVIKKPTWKGAIHKWLDYAG